MNCPSCGAEVPAGSVMCPVCGNPVAAQPTMNYDAPAQPSYVEPSPVPAKKSPLVGIIIAVVALVAVFLVGFFLLGGKYTGTYKLYEVSVSAYGMTETVTEDDLAAYGMGNVSLKVTFNRCKFKGLETYSLTGPYKFKISGEKVTITGSDGSVYGTYDKSEKSITLTEEEDGMEVSFVFKK